MTGTEFIKAVTPLSVDAREDYIVTAFQKGTMPPFMGKRKAITIIGPDNDPACTTPEKTIKIKFDVTPDYLCIGTDADYVRVPMRPKTAQIVVDSLAGSLPTTAMAEAIESLADILLTGTGAPGDFAHHMTTPCYKEHNDIVEKQLKATGKFTLGNLLAGHKKDIVLTKKLATDKTHVYIYDWADKNGVRKTHGTHGDFYVDYSHGVRLVSNLTVVNGEFRTISDDLKSSQTAAFLSTEGPLTVTKYP